MSCSLNPKEFSLQLYIFKKPKTKQNIFTYLRSQTKLVVFLLMNEYETAVYHYKRQTFCRPKPCPYTSGNTLWLSGLFFLDPCLDIHPRGFHGLFFSLLVKNLAASCTLTLLFLITCVSLGLRQNLGMPLTHTHTHTHTLTLPSGTAHNELAAVQLWMK